MIWKRESGLSTDCEPLKSARRSGNLFDATKTKAQHLWDSAAISLEQRSFGTGSGQLSSSARKIKLFLDLIKSGESEKVEFNDYTNKKYF